MGHGVKDKDCIQCGTMMVEVNSSKIRCDICKENNRQNKVKKNYHKPKYSKEEYEENFNKCTILPFALTTKGFNSISDIKISAYRQYFKMKWCDIVSMYGKIDLLYEYIKSEYISYCDKLSTSDMSNFGQKYHEYITYDLIQWFTTDRIMLDCGKIKMVKYKTEDLINNFNRIKEIIGAIPLYNEFIEHTKIPIATYTNHFKLKGNIYQSIINKISFSEDEIELYKTRRLKNKSEQGKITGIMSSNPIPDKELEEDFKQQFDLFLNSYGVNPPRRTFNKLLKHDLSVYRKRYNLSWLGVCEKYGYKVTKEANRSEVVTLKNVSTVLNEEYLPQKTWNWLIGAGGKNMYCDGYFPEHNLVVEFDGSQHRKPIDAFGGVKAFDRRVENDALKEKLLKDNNINLIRIDSRMKWYDIEYIESILSEQKVI